MDEEMKRSEVTGAEWRLTIDEKKRILTDNIYGVDIDPQAVEVTKLSLLLKVLEGETDETLESQLRLFAERALPDLDDNIKCGNSLIGPDFYEDEQMMLLDEEEHHRINVFDWKARFPQVYSGENPGFDAVIGNPPYLRIQGLQEHYGSQISYFTDRYVSAVRRFDMYLLFVEKGFQLLDREGYLGFIIPHKFLNSAFGSGLRKFLIDNRALKSFVSFGSNLVFNQASTYTGILVLRNDNDAAFTYYAFQTLPVSELEGRLATLESDDFAAYDSNSFDVNPWILGSTSVQEILNKLHQHSTTIGETFEGVFQGVVTGADDIYFLKTVPDGDHSDEVVEAFSQREGESIRIERAAIKPILKGEDVSRYAQPDFKHYCIYPYKRVAQKTVILEEEELADSYPLAYSYLNRYRTELENLRLKYKTNPRYWYSCHRGRSIAAFQKERIITPEISFGCNMTISPPGIYHNTKVYSLVPMQAREEARNYWLGILNSRVLWWFLSSTGYVLRGGYFVFKTNYLKPFPIRTIDFSDTEDVAQHNRMVELVERMLELHERLAEARIERERTIVQHQIDATDRQIDRLVYELYGLTDEEVRIVEEATSDNTITTG